MAKSKMNLRYKSPKRERNKNKNEVSSDIQIKSFLVNLFSVVLFIGVVYLGVLGLKALGVFDPGYKKPTKETTQINYEYILLGTVFDRTEKDYYVIFDDYDKNTNKYVNNLVKDNAKVPVYKVDTSKPENTSCLSDTSNPNAKNASELKINDITVIRITKGKIAKYIAGSEKIEEYFNK